MTTIDQIRRQRGEGGEDGMNDQETVRLFQKASRLIGVAPKWWVRMISEMDSKEIRDVSLMLEEVAITSAFLAVTMGSVSPTPKKRLKEGLRIVAHLRKAFGFNVLTHPGMIAWDDGVIDAIRSREFEKRHRAN